MFSFIKMLQNFLRNLKKNKGLWFTTLSVISILGISFSMYILMTMTQNVSKEVYVTMSETYETSLKNRINKKEQNFKKLVASIYANNNILTAMEQNNINAVETIVNTYNENFLKAGFNELSMKFYPSSNQINQYRNSINSVITNKTKVFGIEVLNDGIFVILVEPILKDDNLIGVIEIKESIHTLKAEFEKDNSIFVFLLDEKMMGKLSLKAKTGKYRDVINEYKVEEKKYDGNFFGKLISNGKEGFKELEDKGYLVDDTYYKTYKKISDINGATIGLAILGEQVEGSGAFVNIVDKMTKTVTTVALGLVISILLFMF
ncbi:hypothetical protein [Malaciobacter marinus]|jgi:hypothetical protein|uniref:hypothetical protein n=1 Tax=Malaciobacter marinus TaxID=505249 RepID=UPI0009A89B21|nr:hypothetical protein [Malaciobacter marinus]SKB37916.1 hypothetical protein SAMN06295997_10845 [Malaciobacter marinus]